jgi:hypothetical protein
MLRHMPRREAGRDVAAPTGRATNTNQVTDSARGP